MVEYRVTKYDPQLRNARGAYTRDEWIMFSEVGTEVGGEVLTLEAYEAIEKSYIESAIAFLKDAGVERLSVCGLENSRQTGMVPREGQALDHTELCKAFKSVLREEIWCRFEGERGTFVHFGWDYYMYVGVPVACSQAIVLAEERGLFVEEFASPYPERVE